MESTTMHTLNWYRALKVLLWGGCTLLIVFKVSATSEDIALLSPTFQSQPFSVSETALLSTGDSLFQRQQRAELYFLFERKEKLQALLESQTNYNTDSELLNSSTNAFLYGVLKFNEGKYAEADRYYNDAINNSDSYPVSNDKWQAIVLIYQALNNAYLQQYTLALQQLSEVRGNALNKGWHTLVAHADYMLGDVNYELKDYEAALVHYTRAEEQYGAANPLLKARATMARSQMVNIVGQRSVAFELLDSAIEHFVTLEDISSLAYAYLLKSYYFSKAGDPAQALTWITQSVAMREQLNSQPDIANAYVHYSSLLHDNGNTQEALVYGRKAVELVQNTDDLSGIWDAHVNLALILGDAGLYKEAFEHMHRGERALLKKARLDITAEAARLNSEFNLELEQLKNQHLDKENEILNHALDDTHQKQRVQMWLLIGLSILLVIFVVMIILVYRLYCKNRQLAACDPLTGLYNRRRIMEMGKDCFAITSRYQQSLTVLMLDIDNFKKINDEFGHHEGDVVLVSVARLCQQLLRESDFVGRIGGEEFLFVLPNTSANEGETLALRITNNIRKTVKASGTTTVTVSMGVAQCGPSCRDFIELVNNADKALYKAKESGRDRVTTAFNDPK